MPPSDAAIALAATATILAFSITRQLVADGAGAVAGTAGAGIAGFLVAWGLVRWVRTA